MLDIPQIAVLRSPPHRMETIIPDERRPRWSWERATAQHIGLRKALSDLGLQIVELDVLERCPMSVYVSDAAAIALDRAFVSRFFEPKRRGEEIQLEDAIRSQCVIGHPESPAKVFAGDVVFSDFALWIGLSSRTNEEGAAQLATFYEGYEVQSVESEQPLRSRITYLGGGRFLARTDTEELPFLEDFETVEVPPEEVLAAEAIVLGRRVVISAGCPETTRQLEAHDLDVSSVEVEELLTGGRGLGSLCALYG